MPETCKTCGTIMCQTFDDKPGPNGITLAVPNGKYVCYKCGHSTPSPSAPKYQPLSPIPERYVCNNCAATKAGEECTDCVGKGCNCPCQASPSAESGAREWLKANYNQHSADYTESGVTTMWLTDIGEPDLVSTDALANILEAYAAHVQSPSSEALIEVNGEKCCPLCCKPVFYSPSPDLAWLEELDAVVAKMTPDLYYAEGRDVYTHQVRDMANPNGIIATFGQESSGKSEANARGYVLLRNSYKRMSETIRRLERESSVERTAHTTFEEIAKTNQALLRTERAAHEQTKQELEARTHNYDYWKQYVESLKSELGTERAAREKAEREREEASEALRVSDLLDAKSVEHMMQLGLEQDDEGCWYNNRAIQVEHERDGARDIARRLACEVEAVANGELGGDWADDYGPLFDMILKAKEVGK